MHTPRGPAGLSPPATSVHLTSLSPLLTRGPSPTPPVPKLTLVAAESGGAGLAGQGVQGPAAVGARFTEAAASLLGDSEATSVQGLGAPRARAWMGAARGAVIGKHAAAQRQSPDPMFMLLLLISAAELRHSPGLGLKLPGGGQTPILPQMGGSGVALCLVGPEQVRLPSWKWLSHAQAARPLGSATSAPLPTSPWTRGRVDQT